MQHQSSSAPVSPSTRPGVSIKGFACSSSGDDVSPQSQGSSAQRANSTTVSLLSLLLASSATNFAHQSSAQLADEDSYEDSEGEDEQDLETCADGVMPPPNNSSGSSTSPCVAPHLLRRSCSAPVPIPVNTLYLKDAQQVQELRRLHYERYQRRAQEEQRAQAALIAQQRLQYAQQAAAGGHHA